MIASIKDAMEQAAYNARVWDRMKGGPSEEYYTYTEVNREAVTIQITIETSKGFTVLTRYPVSWSSNYLRV